MNIFLCCQQATGRHAVPAYAFWEGYFKNGVAEAGHAWTEAPGVDWARGLVALSAPDRAAWREETWSRTVAFLQKEHARRRIDLFLSYLFPDQVDPAAVRAIRDLGIPCVNFFCDNVREFIRVPEVYRPFDLHWVPEYKGLALYQRARLPALHAPMACWVPPAWRTPIVEETHPVTFIGTRDEQRANLFASAIARGLAIELRGTGWSAADAPPATSPSSPSSLGAKLTNQIAFARQHGFAGLLRKYARMVRPPPAPASNLLIHARPAPAGDDYWRILRGCTVCVGVNRYPSVRHPLARPDTYSRLRDLEAPMAGACYLTEWTEGLDQLYDLDTEIETYRTAAELADKAAALSSDPARRQRLRVAGQRRALGTHTIGHTLTRIRTQLGLPA